MMMRFLVQPFRLFARYRKMLFAVTKVEFEKKYSGSVFGKLWILLYPALLLSMYLFVYTTVFHMTFPGSNELDYVIYVFCGLIPYIGLMEAVTSGCLSIKQNIHLIKNVMVPIDLIPVRYVLMSVLTETISLIILTALIAANRSFGWNLLALPVALLLQIMMLIGFLWIIAPLGVALPDTAYFVNLSVLFLMFISPIGFRPDMIHGVLRFALYLNPAFYMIEAYRSAVIPGYVASTPVLSVYAGGSVIAFMTGYAFFGRFKKVIADYE